LELELSDADGALSPAEREQAISKFTNTLLTLERQEEHLICLAAADDHEILRRPDASPLAILQLQIGRVAAEAVASAA
jgi:hypothetical protein